MNDVVLSCKNVSKKYTEFKTDIAILKDVNLEIKKVKKLLSSDYLDQVRLHY